MAISKQVGALMSEIYSLGEMRLSAWVHLFFLDGKKSKLSEQLILHSGT